MRLYLDASAIMYAVEGVPAFRDLVIARIAQAVPSGELVTSQLSRLECRVKPLREGDTALLQRFDDFFTREGLTVVDLSPVVVDRATELRARAGFRTPDALHLATAVELAADVFLTGDDRLERCDAVHVEVLRP
jgi:predicted nucleic acid-binding protein